MHDPKTYMPDPISNSMFIEPVSVFTVEETSKKLKSKTSCGHVGISTKLLKGDHRHRGDTFNTYHKPFF